MWVVVLKANNDRVVFNEFIGPFRKESVAKNFAQTINELKIAQEEGISAEVKSLIKYSGHPALTIRGLLMKMLIDEVEHFKSDE